MAGELIFASLLEVFAVAWVSEDWNSLAWDGKG